MVENRDGHHQVIDMPNNIVNEEVVIPPNVKWVSMELIITTTCFNGLIV